MNQPKQSPIRRRTEQIWIEFSARLTRVLGRTTKTIWISAPDREPGRETPRAALRVPLNNRLDYIQRWSPRYDHWLPILMRLVGAAHPDETIVDIGANVGDTVIAGRLAGCRANMIGIEASHAFAELFRENLRHNEHLPGTTHLVEALVIGRSTNVRFEMHRGGTGKTEIGSSDADNNTAPAEGVGGVAGVPVRRVSLEDLRIEACSLLKIDTDGFDAYILDGGMDWIGTTRPIVWAEAEVTEADAVSTWHRVLEEMHLRRYTRVMVFDNEGAMCFSGFLDRTAILAIVDLIEYSRREMRNFILVKRLKKPVHYFDVALFPETRVALWEAFDRQVRDETALTAR
jgi:FkbM family methyltransferase